MKRYSLLIVFGLIAGSILQACAPKPAAMPVLKFAVLPVIDAVPLYAAQQEGLFEKHGVKVELVPVAAAPDRDQLLMSGQADGAIDETSSVMLFNQDQVKLQIVRYALRPTETSGHFFILASAKSGITSPDQLKNVEIGVSQGTVIDYVTQRLLEAQGLTDDEIKTIAVPKISDRMSLLASGELKAGTLPDPLASLAVQQGAVIVLDDSKYPQYGYSVISFRSQVIQSEPEAIKGFLAAIEEATNLVNNNPQKFANILSDNKIVPEALMGSYKLPAYPSAGVPSEAEWNDAMQWMLTKGLVKNKVDYQTSVNPALLP